MSDARKAGTVILENLTMFNEAVVLFETNVHVEIMEELDTAIELWAKNIGWRVEANWREDTDSELWMAPTDWNINNNDEDEDEEDFKAWFMFKCLNKGKSDSFVIADLCGVGQDQIGFWFEVQYGCFGGKKAFANSISPEITTKISALKFLVEKNGQYFLPVRLDHKELAIAWENEDYDTVFSPITTALDILKSSKSIFDQLLIMPKE